MSGKLLPVPVAKATKGQLVAFAEATLQRDEAELAGLAVEKLRSEVRAAGFQDSILVAAPPPEPVHPASDSPRDLLEPRRMDPNEERWILAEFLAETDIEGNPLDAEIFVEVNDDYAYVPKGLRVWLREILYWHINDATDVRYREVEVPSERGYPPRTRTVREDRKVYPHTVHAVGGRVVDDDALPDVREGELIISPRASQAAVISLRKEIEMERRRSEGLELLRNQEAQHQHDSRARAQLMASYTAV